MKHRILFSAIVLCWACIASSFVGVRAASSQQWFPSTGTSIDYAISVDLRFGNGTVISETKFNVLNASGWWMIEPAYITRQNNGPKTGWTPLYNDTTMILRHAYSELNSTHLKRDTTFVAGNAKYTGKFVSYCLSRTNMSYMTLTQNATANLAIQKNAFPVENAWDIADYINNEAGVGATVLAGYYDVISVTTNSIVAFYNQSVDSNKTYTADKTGQVSSYIYTSDFGMALPGQKNSILRYERVPSALPILGNPIDWVIVGILGLVIVILLIVAVQRGKKR
jgi:hypothetical protein